jgi:hypothetical protein
MTFLPPAKMPSQIKYGSQKRFVEMVEVKFTAGLQAGTHGMAYGAVEVQKHQSLVA